eukprot:scaffold25576_cov20-Tisochrysis_lutea.AAC.2
MQLELRMLAHLSGDPDLCTTLQQCDVDPFQRMVCFWLNCGMGQGEDKEFCKATNAHAQETSELSFLDGNVTKEQRERVKRLTYGLIYGMGLQRLGVPCFFQRLQPTFINWYI